VRSQKQIIFVCHSMGGIVARRFLISDQAEIIDTRKRIGLFLVSSPSSGQSTPISLEQFHRYTTFSWMLFGLASKIHG
jgi:alpha-beta hydrolase superfamily lysophospholipase